MQISDDLIKQDTLHWVRSFVIELNICPFAKRVVDQGSLAIEVIHANDVASGLEALMSAVHRLDANPELETMLLVYPSYFTDFLDYLDFVDLADVLMAEQGYEGIYQLATFHPDYCFAGVNADDVSNYTNRSPYPMLHLLREISIEKAIDYYGDTESIPETNIAMMRKLGLDKIKAKLTR